MLQWVFNGFRGYKSRICKRIDLVFDGNVLTANNVVTDNDFLELMEQVEGLTAASKK